MDRADLDEELLDEEDRITGALQIGLVGCRRSASWVSSPHLPLSFSVMFSWLEVETPIPDLAPTTDQETSPFSRSFRSIL